MDPAIGIFLYIIFNVFLNYTTSLFFFRMLENILRHQKALKTTEFLFESFEHLILGSQSLVLSGKYFCWYYYSITALSQNNFMKAYQYSNKSKKENGIHQTNEKLYEKIVSLATLSHAITGSIESPLQLFFQVYLCTIKVSFILSTN